MIDIDKEYRTRDGREVRIYATDGGDLVEGQTIHGAVLNGNNWVFAIWNAETGKNYANSAAISKIDLIEVKRQIKETVWINIYNNYWSISSTEKFAKDKADCGILARVKVDIDVEEGHGL